MGVPYAEVIGDPIAHSKSPLIHNFWLEKMGLVGEYRAMRVGPEDLVGYLETRRNDPDWRGCNVTMPLKQLAWKLVDTVDPSTRRIGALNTIVLYSSEPGGLAGTNTDWIGLNLALDTYHRRPRRAAVIGTGGAARAAMTELALGEVPHVTVISRSEARAADLLETFGLSGGYLPLNSAPEADLLINASPLGMHGYPSLPVDLSALASGATVADMVYYPLETPLLREARERGLRPVDGIEILIWQASMAFTHFFKDSPADVGFDELRELLTR